MVSGNIPLQEKIIMPAGKKYKLKEGRELPQSETYALCRCGKSKNAPFCDGSHKFSVFDGTETASKDNYTHRAKLIKGPGVNMLDDHRCALGRFCHRDNGNAWELTHNSDDAENKSEAIQAAVECPAGRLTAVEKTGALIELSLEPAVYIVQDPEKDSSAGIFVQGNIPIESSEGGIYEIRNRVALCRCGKSSNKPFCDGTHCSVKYLDKL